MNILSYLKPEEFDPQALIFKCVTLLAIVIVAYLILRIFERTLRRTGDMIVESKKKSHQPAQAARAQTVLGMIGQVGRVLITAVAMVVLLGEIGVDVAPILAGAGVVGLAVGFGAQSLVKDFFSGLCLILENQVTIGDWATINGKSGFVEVLNFRITVLRDLDGTIHVFPNGSINELSNSTHVWSAAVLDIPVPYGQNFETASNTFLAIAKSMKSDEYWNEKFVEDFEVLGLQEFTDRGMVIRCRIKTIPGVQWAAGREFRSRLYETWKKQGIKVPVTSRTLTINGGDVPVAS